MTANQTASREPPLDGTTQARVFAIIARQAKLDIAAIKPESTLKDLGVASLDAIETLFNIEEAFDINFPDQGTNFDTATVQSLVDAVNAARTAKDDAAEGMA